MAYTAIDDPEAYFQVKLYTGDGADPTRAITLDGDTDMSPNLILFKNRGGNHGTRVIDSVRGVNEVLVTHTTTAESTDDQYGYLASFDSDGFTTQKGSSGDQWNVNKTSDTYVAWCWKESATAGFDIISYTGDGSDRDLSHSLSASPEFIIIKQRSGSQDWSTQSTALGLANYVILNDTNASAGTSGALVDAVSSSTISVDDNAYVNENTSTYIGYLWRSVQGFSAMGKYTGNGNADGAFIYTGFRPAYIMIRDTGNAENWFLFDNKRDGYNVNKVLLYANTITADTTTGANQIDLLSNGFKCRSTDNGTNRSGATGFIYMAFAEAPFVNSNGVPCNAR